MALEIVSQKMKCWLSLRALVMPRAASFYPGSPNSRFLTRCLRLLTNPYKLQLSIPLHLLPPC